MTDVVRSCPIIQGYPTITATDTAATDFTANIYDLKPWNTAITASSITSNVCTVTVASGHGRVAGEDIWTASMTTNVAQTAQATISSVTATTIVFPLTAGDTGDNGTGTIYFVPGTGPRNSSPYQSVAGASADAPITAAGDGDTWVLNLGHSTVTADYDGQTQEGGMLLVKMIGASGSNHSTVVHFNDADHVNALFPDGAIYAVANSGNTGTGFPNGSIYLPCQNLGDACSILSSRGAEILDCSGSWNGGGSGSGGVLQSDIGSALSAARATIRTRSTAAWYPHNSGDIIDLVDCKVVSVNVPYGFAIATFTNGTYFAGAPKLVNCRIQTIYFTGNGASRYGALDAVSCKFDGDVFLSGAQTPGCWAADAVGCINGGTSTIDCSSNSGSTLSWVSCSGAWTIANMAAGKAISMTGISGMPDITLAASTSNAITVTLTGAYNSLVNNTGGALSSLTERKLAAIGDAMDLVADAVDTTSLADDAITAAKIANGAIDAATFATGAIDNAAIAAGAITATEAPNLDAAVSSRAVAGDAMALTAGAVDGIWDEATAGHVTAGTYGVAVTDVLADTASIQPTIATNLDVAVSTRAAPGAAMDLVNGAVDANAIANNAINVSAFASNAIDNGVLATSAVNEIRDAILSDSTPFNGATIATLSTNVTTLLSRLGVNDMAILRGALLGNYILDGGSGDASANYDGNGCMTSGRIRIFADASATQAATAGSADGTDSEIYRVDITATPISGQAYPSTVTGVGQ